MLSKRLEVVRIEGRDPRSDDGRRVVELSRECVVIKRVVSGAAMSIRVGLSGYRGPMTRFIAGRNIDGYELWLTHDDPDLALLLAVNDDRRAIEALRLEWARFLGLAPRWEDAVAEESEAQRERSAPYPSWAEPRARGFLTATRRPRFLARRKVGTCKRPQPIHPRPRILFDGSRPER